MNVSSVGVFLFWVIMCVVCAFSLWLFVLCLFGVCGVWFCECVACFLCECVCSVFVCVCV